MQTIINENKPDNASCPNCGHYNAMLGGWAANNEPATCRDCGFKAIVVDHGGQYMNLVGKKKAGRLLDGREWNEYPEVNNAR